MCPTPVCVYAHKNDHVGCTHVQGPSPCQSSVDYGNTKRPSMDVFEKTINSAVVCLFFPPGFQPRFPRLLLLFPSLVISSNRQGEFAC